MEGKNDKPVITEAEFVVLKGPVQLMDREPGRLPLAGWAIQPVFSSI